MPDPAEPLKQAIAALDSQRGRLPDDVLDAALAPLRARLAALAPPPEQQLRQVSVLFVDVAGSTALSRTLDVEDAHALIDGALQRYAALVRAQGGTVLQYAGDSLLAAFGTPQAREDDAERAVLAALDVLAAAHAGGSIVVRAGIATGPVLLGGGVDGAHSIRGNVVNLAARMEQTAPHGALRVCADTRRLVRGLFDLTPQAPLVIKGYAEPVSTWLVAGRRSGAAPQATRGVGGVHAPLVGRQVELATLQQAFEDRCAGLSEAPAVLVVLGDAGLGKSRLSAEFRAWTRRRLPGMRWLEAQGSERATGQPYGLLRQLFLRHLGMRDSDTAAEARATWMRATTPLLGSGADAAVLGHLLGLDFAAHPEVQPLLQEGRQLRDRAFFHATQALRAIAAASPALALFVEDLQWADPGSLEFLQHAQHDGAGLLLLLCSSRPGFELQHPGWAAQPGRLRIELAPLDGGAAAALAAALLSPLPGAPAALRERLIAGAEGNPFYMEELVNMLIDRGVIVVADGDAGGGWQLGTRPLDEGAMPRTLTGVLQARLDELDAAQAQALQFAAVVGHVFWAEALRALGLPEDTPLQPLVQRQLIVQRSESTLAGQAEYTFRHHLLHQVCYERVLRKVRVPAHACVAQWLATQPGERPLDLIAEHHERGGQPAQALQAWHKAAEAARARYANAQALAHADRALALGSDDDAATGYALRLLRSRVLHIVAERDALARELDTLEALAERLDDDARRAEAACQRANFLYDSGEAAAAVQVATRALAWAGDRHPMLACEAGRGLAAALAHLGRTAEARARAQTALALARQAGDLRMEGALLNETGSGAYALGDVAEARRCYAQALERHRSNGNRSHEAGTLSNLGYVDLGLGDYAVARERFMQARELFARIGQRSHEGIVLINLAIVSLNLAQPQRAIDEAAAALPLLTAAGSRWAEAAALRVQGQAALALGELQRAAAHLVAARETFRTLGLDPLALEVDAALAQVALAQGDLARAAALADRMLAVIDGGLDLDGTEEPMRVRLALWQVLQAAGDPRAGPCLQAAVDALQARAARIDDAAARASYLERVPHHRALRAAAAAR